MSADFFLKLDGIKGESKDDKHKDEIDVQAWSWGESNAGSSSFGGGGGAGKVSMQDFNFSMSMNKATPELMLYCAIGKPIKTATLVARKAGGGQQEFLTIKMSDVLVSSYQTGGSAGSGIPIESISLNFAKIEYEYKPQKPDGSLDSAVKAGYDLKANKKV
jgi:type VI secretion system secreted protein Hcp